MKRRYQIDRERAVRRFEEGAAHGERGIQLHLPLKEIAAALQDGVGALMRQVGLELMQLIMEDEVRQLAGGAHRGQIAPLPPSVSFMSRLPSAVPPPKA